MVLSARISSSDMRGKEGPSDVIAMDSTFRLLFSLTVQILLFFRENGEKSAFVQMPLLRKYALALEVGGIRSQAFACLLSA
jgi:hypothetical protein